LEDGAYNMGPWIGVGGIGVVEEGIYGYCVKIKIRKI
jgi:hypothetical protein